MKCQMMRVISSPSSSTTGLATLIFAMISPWACTESSPAGRQASGGGYSATGPVGEEQFQRVFAQVIGGGAPFDAENRVAFSHDAPVGPTMAHHMLHQMAALRRGRAAGWSL